MTVTLQMRQPSTGYGKRPLGMKFNHTEGRGASARGSRERVVHREREGASGPSGAPAALKRRWQSSGRSTRRRWERLRSGWRQGRRRRRSGCWRHWARSGRSRRSTGHTCCGYTTAEAQGSDCGCRKHGSAAPSTQTHGCRLLTTPLPSPPPPPPPPTPGTHLLAGGHLGG